MKNLARILQLAAVSMVLLLQAGCSATRNGSLEVMDARRAYGASLAVADDFHVENPALEMRLASALRDALQQQGLKLATGKGRADLVVLPTLGRIVAAPVERRLPVRARSLGTALPPSTRILSSECRTGTIGKPLYRAGLLLTAVRRADYEDFGLGKKFVPVWRIYVWHEVYDVSWRVAAGPLVEKAARAAAPLAVVPSDEDS